MERVRIAEFADPDVASLAADFLEDRGFDAAFLNQSGRGGDIAYVLVARNQASSGYALLQRVSRGEFAEGVPEAEDHTSQLAIDLTRALRGSGYRGSTSAWLNLLPIVVVAAALLLAPLAVLLLRRMFE